MKRLSSFKIFAAVIVLLMSLLLFACVVVPPVDGGGTNQGGTNQGGTNQGGTNQGGTNQGGTNQGGNGDVDPNMLQLITNSKANFRLVYTTGSGSANIKAVGNLVVRLRELGVDIEDAVSDSSADYVSDCEIIVGANARNRGDACNISDKTLGLGGYRIKTVGKRIVIAGGTNELTAEAFAIFVSEVFGITDTQTSLPELSVKKDYSLEKKTEYNVTSVRVAGNDLKNYILLIDVNNMYGGSNSISAFRNRLYETTGYWLQTGNPEVPEAYKYKLIIRYVQDAGEDGFRAYVSGNDLIFECAYQNAFDKAFGEIVERRIYNVNGVANFSSTYYETKVVSRVYYKDYGAKGDGVTNDLKAILEAHQYANTGGQKVYAEEGAIYNIGDNIYSTVNIRTDVDFRGATFIINDVGSAAYATRTTPLFTLARDLGSTETYNMQGITTNFGENIKVNYGDTALPWLAGHLSGPALVRIENSGHRDFVRHGSNQNSGAYRMDMLVVDVNGNISPDTPVGFDYDQLTYMVIYYTDCKPITVENGNFINICCQVLEETQMQNKFHEYRRCFKIERPNVTVKGMKHRMEGEPTLNWQTGKFGTFGDCSESYPYYGFFIFDYAYNSLIEDCDLTGHTTYYEDKPATASTGWVKPDPVPMGTYDFVIERSANITFKNVTQYNSSGKGLADSRYWGIMSSNGSKNLTFEDCEINRFDAHRGFWNATLKNTVIGHSINVIGGGTFNLIGVTKMTGEAFISLRGDYGATFRGDMNIIDCYHQCISGFNTYKGATGSSGVANNTYIINSGFKNSAGTDEGSYWYWDFGYTCYLPENIVIDNFKSDAKKNVYIFNNLQNTVFGADNSATGAPITNVYQITKSITLNNISADNNMERIKICSATGANYSSMRSIPLQKNYKEE